MAKRLDPNAPATARDVERVVATMAELSLDLERSVRAAVPIAQIIFAEIAARYRVAAGATLLTLRGSNSP
jgi:hypothetical protein